MVGRLCLLLAACASLAYVDVTNATTTSTPVAVTPPKHAAPSTLPALPIAAIDDSLSIKGADISAKTETTRMTVETMINGHGPFRFVVDSGADSSVVGLGIAKSLNLPLGNPAMLHTITSSGMVNRVQVAELAFGQNKTFNLLLPALDEKDLDSDGTIGIDVLNNQRLMLDFEKRIIKVEDGEESVPKAKADNVVSARRKNGQLILTQVEALNLPIQAMIDTGSEITIGNLALRDKLLPGNREKFGIVRLIGVTGVEMRIHMARISELKIGSITLTNVPMAFADIPPFALFGLQKKPAVLIGTDLMSVFRRVSLDFRDRKVRFQLRQCGTDGVVINRASAVSATRIRSGNNEVVCAR